MRTISRTLHISVLLVSIAIAASAQTDWKGSYTFEEDGGKNAGGTAVFISHELNVFDDGEVGLAASLESNGYQTSSNLICIAKAVGTRLEIYFREYGEDNMFEPYKAGDLLLTLEKKTEKGKEIILTHWSKFTASIPKNERSGKVYFKRVPVSKL